MGTEKIPANADVINWSDVVLTSSSQNVSDYDPVLELYDVSKGLQFLADNFSSEDSGPYCLLSLLASNVNGIAKVLAEKQWREERKKKGRG